MTSPFRTSLGLFSLLFGGRADREGNLPFSLVLFAKGGGGRGYGIADWTWNLADAAWTATQLHRSGRDVYFHLALHDYQQRWRLANNQATDRPPVENLLHDPASGREIIQTYFRGKSITARAIGALWLDIDFGDAGHEKRHLPPDRAAALQLIEEIGRLFMPPSLVVDSGHGFHVYWILREPWTLESEEERHRATTALRALHGFAGSVAKSMGEARDGSPWEIDAVHDLSRVLRVPGTANRKGAGAVTVRTERLSTRRFNPSDFEDHPALSPFVVQERGAARAGWVGPDSTPASIPARPDVEAEARVRDRLAEAFERDPHLAVLWRHEADDEITKSQSRRGVSPDTSMSVYDLWISIRLASLGWSSDDIYCALRIHYRDRGRVPDEKSSAYFSRTIGKAVAQVENRETQVHPLSDIPEDDEPIDLPPSAPPPPSSTRPIVRTSEEARAISAEIADEWIPGDRSLSYVGWPGIGKTTAFGLRLVRGLASDALGFEVGVAVLALPTRKSVLEKAAVLRQFVAEEGLDVRVLELLGRSPELDSGWHCEEVVRQRMRAELHRSSCPGCPAVDTCESETGHFLHTRNQVLEALKDAAHGGVPVLLVLTLDALHHRWREIPADAPIVVDDPGSGFGLVREINLRYEDIGSAIEQAKEFLRERARHRSLKQLQREQTEWEERAAQRAEAFETLQKLLRIARDGGEAREAVARWAGRIDGNPFAAAKVLTETWDRTEIGSTVDGLRRLERRWSELHPALAADLVARVLTSLRLPRSKKVTEKRDRVAGAVSTLPDVYRRALLEDLVKAPRDKRGRRSWPWEEPKPADGPDLRPSFARLAIEVAREAADGRPPVVRRHSAKSRGKGQPEFVLRLADRDLIRRAGRGFVAWLGVGPMPSPIVEELGARQEVVLAEPTGLRVIECGIRGYLPDGRTLALSFGPGKRRPGKPSDADEITRAFADGLSKLARSGSATWRGRPIGEVGAVLPSDDREALGQPSWVAHYGADHASTDRLEHVDTLVVRRFVPPYAAISDEATALRRAVGLPDAAEPGQMSQESRTWSGGGGEPITTTVLSDPLEREMLRYHELHNQLNAIGRCRPLNGHPRTVFLLAGRPFDWVRVEMEQIREVARELGISIRLPDSAAKQRALDAHNASVAAKAAGRRAELARILEDGNGLSQADLARRLGVSRPTVARDLAALKSNSETPLCVTRGIGFLIPRVTQSGAGVPDAPEVRRELLHRAGSFTPSLRAIQRALREYSRAARRAPPLQPVLVIPRRSDHAETLRAVAEAVASLLGGTPVGTRPEPRFQPRTLGPEEIDAVLLSLQPQWERMAAKERRAAHA